jgi:hypothetical protein
MRAVAAFLLVVCALAWGSEDIQPYTLEYPGVVFEWLPPELATPVPGTLAEESGSIASAATSDGTEFHVYYWQEDVPPGDARESWMDTRLPSVLPSGLGDHLITGDVVWMEGSQLSQYRNSRSLGLVIRMNFNVIDEEGDVLGRGRAYAAFRNGYTVMMYCLSPTDSSGQAITSLDGMVAMAHLE